MKRLLFLLVVFLFIIHKEAYSSINLIEYVINGVILKVVSLDMSDRNVKVTPVVSWGLPFKEEPFYSFICRARPVAAINGTYFNMATSTPVGEVTIDGVKYHSSGIGTVFAITRENKALFFDAKIHRRIDRSNFLMTLGGGPRILESGRIVTNYRREGFRDSHIFEPAIRTAVAMNRSDKLYLVVSLSAVTLTKLGETLLSIGCSDAINLDGGGSYALFYRGVVIVNPRRNLSNILAVYYGRKESSWSGFDPRYNLLHESLDKSLFASCTAESNI